MSRRTKLIVIFFSGIALVAAILVVYIYITTDRSGGERVADRAGEVLFPFGDSGDSATTTDRERSGEEDGTATTTPDNRVQELPPAYRPLSSAPVAGAVVLKRTSTSTITGFGARARIHFMERGTGHIYRAYANELRRTRLSNTTIPQVYRALWTPDGARVLAQFLDNTKQHIRTFSATLTERGITGFFFPRDLGEVTISPSGEQVFYLEETENGAVGTVVGTDGTSPNQVFSSPLNEWLVQWVTPNEIVLTTKPSGGVRGYAYILNPETGNTTKVLEEKTGLTTLTSPDGEWILYSESPRGNGNITVRLYNITTGVEEQSVFPTFPEKCVWHPNEPTLFCAVPQQIPSDHYPDSWYRGEVSFNDTFWKFNLTEDYRVQLAHPDGFDQPPVDATRLSMSPDGDYLVFIDKKTGILYGVDVKRLE